MMWLMVKEQTATYSLAEGIEAEYNSASRSSTSLQEVRGQRNMFNCALNVQSAKSRLWELHRSTSATQKL